MSNLKQELFEIDVYGFTILENVLTLLMKCRGDERSSDPIGSGKRC